MFRSLIAISVLSVLLAGCSKSNPEDTGSVGPSTTAKLTEVPGMARYALAEPIHVNNVSIIPVISKENPATGPDYDTLAEAKKNAWIEIIEEGDEGTVESLIVKNVGPKPILLLAGELLLGGKQDRVVAKDTIVPQDKEVVVPVYCVEPGRWSGSSHKFSYGDTTVPMRVREQAMYGAQQDVWDEVSSFNSVAKAESDGRTTLQAGLENEEVQSEIAARLASVVAELKGHKNVVGAMFLIDGEVQTLELFGNAKLFEASRDSLLKGALAEAAINKDKKAPAFDLATCAKFMADAMKSDRVVANRQKGDADTAFVSTRRASPASKGMEIHQDDESPGGSSMLLHGSYSKQ